MKDSETMNEAVKQIETIYNGISPEWRAYFVRELSRYYRKKEFELELKRKAKRRKSR